MSGLTSKILSFALLTVASMGASANAEAGSIWDWLIGVLQNGGSNSPTTSVPEPATLALLSMGVAGVALMRKRRNRG